MGNKLIESIMGAVVLAVAGLFLMFAYRQADLRAVEGYRLAASFTSVGGLPRGSDVRINGIKVGTVVDERLDPQSYNALVDMTISPQVKLPVDTVASISSEGLLGGKYVRLDPGRSHETLPVGGTIANTKDYKSVEEMVGEIIFLATAESGKPAAPAPAPQAAPGPAPAAPEPASPPPPSSGAQPQ